MDYQYILVSTEGPLGICALNRPKQLNALTIELMGEVATALEAFDSDQEIRCIILTGNEKAFAAGADIKEMANKNSIDMLKSDFSHWDRLARVKKPIIAAVSGYAFGGGCELAMNCDMIVASESAQFGQPEIKIGIIPGAGGTQRLPRTIGKFKAMEMVLTGNTISALEALQYGLVNKVAPMESYLDEAKKLGMQIAAMPPLAVRLGKEAVRKSLETTLAEGVNYERSLFFLLLGSEDKKEGMQAFIEKRKGNFTGR